VVLWEGWKNISVHFHLIVGQTFLFLHEKVEPKQVVLVSSGQTSCHGPSYFP
jgi:hypothetical protein